MIMKYIFHLGLLANCYRNIFNACPFAFMLQLLLMQQGHDAVYCEGDCLSEGCCAWCRYRSEQEECSCSCCCGVERTTTVHVIDEGLVVALVVSACLPAWGVGGGQRAAKAVEDSWLGMDWGRTRNDIEADKRRAVVEMWVRSDFVSGEEREEVKVEDLL